MVGFYLMQVKYMYMPLCLIGTCTCSYMYTPVYHIFYSQQSSSCFHSYVLCHMAVLFQLINVFYFSGGVSFFTPQVLVEFVHKKVIFLYTCTGHKVTTCTNYRIRDGYLLVFFKYFQIVLLYILLKIVQAIILNIHCFQS